MDLYTKLSTIMEDLTVMFNTRMETYEEELKNASNPESTHKSVASLSRDFSDFKCLIWKALGSLKSQMELLLLGLDRHEMAARRKVLLLHGVAGDADCLTQVMNILTDRMKMKDITPADITACHRLGINTKKDSTGAYSVPELRSS